MHTEDKDVMAKLLLVLGLLVIVTVVVFLGSRLLSVISANATKGEDGDDYQKQRAALVEERIQKVGTVRAGVVPKGPVVRSGKEIVEAVCSSCHKAGVLGAPKIGEAGDWAPRVGQGFDGLVKSAIGGKGSMPAKGGDSTLQDDDIKKAVAFMLKESGQKAPDVESAPAGGSAEAPAAGGAAASSAQPAGSAQGAMASTGAAAPAAVGASASAKGEQVYKAACSSCHDLGVAGSPKLGDKAAWQARIGAGAESLYRNAINGKGGMPPKGGRLDLADADVKAAVDFMVAQSQ